MWHRRALRICLPRSDRHLPWHRGAQLLARCDGDRGCVPAVRAAVRARPQLLVRLRLWRPAVHHARRPHALARAAATAAQAGEHPRAVARDTRRAHHRAGRRRHPLRLEAAAGTESVADQSGHPLRRREHHGRPPDPVGDRLCLGLPLVAAVPLFTVRNPDRSGVRERALRCRRRCVTQQDRRPQLVARLGGGVHRRHPRRPDHHAPGHGDDQSGPRRARRCAGRRLQVVPDCDARRSSVVSGTSRVSASHFPFS